MLPKIRILSYHYIPNNGAFLFAFSLLERLKSEFSHTDVKITNYKSTRLALSEDIKQFKIFQSIPTFYLDRARMWNRITREYLDIDYDLPTFTSEENIQKYFSKQYDMIVVGMDVWCIIRGTTRPTFPNIYWLPKKIQTRKIAYGVSAYNSDLALVNESKGSITSYLNEFDVIGSRDRFTHDLVMNHRTRTDGLISRIPDPTFFYEIQPTNVMKKLVSMGIDLDRPMLGVLLFGNDNLSREIQSYYRAKGYQIIALSMFNPFADFNLGHKLNPFEWAEVFQLLSFCFTDRFHGTIFCLKNQIPFISIEKEPKISKNQSKLYDLLTDFELEFCYQDPLNEQFDTKEMFYQAEEIHKSWENALKPKITPKIQEINQQHRDFLDRMKTVVDSI